MAQQTKPNLPVDHDCSPPFWISLRLQSANQEWRHRATAKDFKAHPRRRAREKRHGASRNAEPQKMHAVQPKTSSVMVLNQPLANAASWARKAADAFGGLTPPPASTSTPSFAAIKAGDRNAIVRRHQAVASVDQPWLIRLFAGQEFDYRGSAHFRLRVRGERRFWHRAGYGGVANHVDIGLQSCDSKVSGLIGHQPVLLAMPARLGNSASLLRRNDIDDVTFVAFEIRDQRHFAGVDGIHFARRWTVPPIRDSGYSSFQAFWNSPCLEKASLASSTMIFDFGFFVLR